MEDFFYIFLHLDQYLIDFSTDYGNWIYVAIFLVIFCETGLIVFPYVPGDGILFTAGVLASTGNLNPFLVFFISVLAAFLGNHVNFSVGRLVGKPILEGKKYKLIKQKNIESTQKFYRLYGNRAIVLSRFMPVFRTFVPFIAGMAHMDKGQFYQSNIIGATFWVGMLMTAGLLLGNAPFVHNHFTWLFMGLIILTWIPFFSIGVHWFKGMRHHKNKMKV